jgi:hypothetical protein
MVTASRTTPTRKSAAPEPEKPTFHFSIKQAMAEREEAMAEEPVEPFVIEGLKGDIITFRNPADIGWQEAASVSISEPYHAIRTMLLPADYKIFVKQGDFPREVLEDLIQGWLDHHGIVAPGN